MAYGGDWHLLLHSAPQRIPFAIDLRYIDETLVSRFFCYGLRGRVSRNYRLVMPVRIGAIFRRVAQSSTLARVPAGLQKSSLARPLRGCERFKGAILMLECRHAIVLAYDYSWMHTCMTGSSPKYTQNYMQACWHTHCLVICRDKHALS